MSRWISLYVCLLGCFYVSAQQPWVWLDKKEEECQDGSALLHLQVGTHYDSLAIRWSTGALNRDRIGDLKAGDYWVQVHVVLGDSLMQTLDTLIHFSVEKVLCPVQVAKYFSPNDDGYNDRFMIGYIERYPEFELIIYNRWGQRIHHQQKQYVPWDGKWLGSDLPDGTYYFVLFYDRHKKDQLLQGDITILR